MTSEFHHTPVLLPQTIEALQPRPGGRFVDATLGAGGHAEKILERTAPNGTLLGIDADPVALEAARRRLAPFGSRVTFVNAYFDDLERISPEYDVNRVDGILFDLGVSSPQLDRAERGFSFQATGPLDMRMGPSASTTAADIINNASPDELQRIFREYGEERFSGRITARIVAERQREPILTTDRLAGIVARAKPKHSSERIHPATRVFQALRIAVNDELGRLERALPQAVHLLRGGGRLAVISFHSLEDRIVKQFMRAQARGCICPPQVPVCVCGRQPTLRLVHSRSLVAGATEVEANPRSRSARLRVAERLPASEITTIGQGEDS